MVKTIGCTEFFRELWRTNRVAVVVACLAVVYTVFGFVIAPQVLKGVLEQRLPRLLHRGVAIETVRLNPFSFSVTVDGFTLQRKDGKGRFVSFDRLFVNLEVLSVFKKALIVKSVSINAPFIDFDFLGDRSYSFSDLLGGGEVEEEIGKKSDPLLFSLSDIEISGGNIRYHDLPAGKDHRITDLELSIPSVSNLPGSVEAYIQPRFSAVINGTTTSLTGQSKPFDESLATELRIKMQEINIPEYLAYFPNQTGVTAGSALADIDATLTYLSPGDSPPQLLMSGTVTVKDVEMVDREGRSYLVLPSITVSMAESNLTAREIRLAGVKIDAPELSITRLVGGDILPFSLLGVAGDDAGKPTPGNVSTGGSAEETLSFSVDRFTLENGVVNFNDKALGNPAEVKIGKLFLNASSLSNIENAPSGNFSFSLLVNGAGRIGGEGSLAVEPLAVESSVEIHDIRLRDFQSYISDRARILVGGGAWSAQGDFDVEKVPGNPSLISFSGMSTVEDLALSDPVSGDDLFRWQELQLNHITYSSRPPELAIDEIRVQDPYADILVGDDGTVNVSTLGVEKTGGSEEPVSTKDGTEMEAAGESVTERLHITLDNFQFNNGRIRFMDRSVEPAYGAGVSQLNGSVTGLSSDGGSRAEVRLDGQVDQQAPLAISGVINPFAEETFADIGINFNDFNLSPLTPYTVKYAGYTTDKGKLNFNLKYRVEGRKLESSHKIFLDQFTLGHAVGSPDATSLPVRLAVSLLKNRKGEIHLDIPVTGDLDDPEFSVSRVVLDVIANLIAKAATSPFALLGNLIPEGVDLRHIVFQPGSGELTGEAEEKLQMVEKVLYERPGLKIEIHGRVDPEADRAALAKGMLAQLIKLEKIRNGDSGKGREPDVRTVRVTPEEYPDLLEQAYNKAFRSAPAAVREQFGEVKGADNAEMIAGMERFLLQGIRVDDEDLRLLAIDRGNRVLRYMVEGGRIEPSRLFMIEPQPVGGEKPGEAVRSMVELSIK